MDRKEFLSLIGISAGAVVFGACMNSCKKEDSSPEPTKADFTIDLSATPALANNGGFLVKDGIIIAKTMAGAYIAVSAACTHEGTIIQYQGGNNRFFCPNHGSAFSNSGSVLNGPATKSLQQFNTSVSGNILRVFS